MLFAIVLQACTHAAPPSVWDEPLPEPVPPVVEQVERRDDDCQPAMLLPGEPVTLDCRGQVITDAEAVELIAADKARDYWRDFARLSMRYRAIDRMAAKQVHQDAARLRRALVARDWLAAGALVLGLGMGAAYLYATQGAR